MSVFLLIKVFAYHIIVFMLEYSIITDKTFLCVGVNIYFTVWSPGQLNSYSCSDHVTFIRNKT